MQLPAQRRNLGEESPKISIQSQNVTKKIQYQSRLLEIEMIPKKFFFLKTRKISIGMENESPKNLSNSLKNGNNLQRNLSF